MRVTKKETAKFLREQDEKLANFLKATGLKKSSSTNNQLVFPWLSTRWFSLDSGFDHTIILYDPKTKEYFILTEPYDGIEGALRTMYRQAQDSGKMFYYVKADNGKGLWNPPYTTAIIFGRRKPETLEKLQRFADALPCTPVGE